MHDVYHLIKSWYNYCKIYEFVDTINGRSCIWPVKTNRWMGSMWINLLAHIFDNRLYPLKWVYLTCLPHIGYQEACEHYLFVFSKSQTRLLDAWATLWHMRISIPQTALWNGGCVTSSSLSLELLDAWRQVMWMMWCQSLWRAKSFITYFFTWSLLLLITCASPYVHP